MKIFLTLATLLFVLLSSPALVIAKTVNLIDGIKVELPDDFKIQKVSESPPAFVAVGAGENGSDEHCPAVIIVPGAPVPMSGHDDYLKRAKSAALNTIKKFGLTVDSEKILETPDGKEYEITASNESGKTWWNVRVIHRQQFSSMIVTSAWEETQFRQLSTANGLVKLAN